MRSALFWYFTQCRIAVPYWRFWATCQSHLQGPSSPRRRLEGRTYRLSRNVSTELPFCVA